MMRRVGECHELAAESEEPLVDDAWAHPIDLETIKIDLQALIQPCALYVLIAGEEPGVKLLHRCDGLRCAQMGVV